MENPDFEMPSPKRQRTNSPPQHARPPPQTSINDQAALDHSVNEQSRTAAAESIPQDVNSDIKGIVTEETDMLDVLMQHVESEAASKENQASGLLQQQEQPKQDEQTHPIDGRQEKLGDVDMGDAETITGVSQTAESSAAQPHPNEVSAPNGLVQSATAPRDSVDVSSKQSDLPAGLEPTAPDVIDHLRIVADANGLPSTSDTLASDQIPPATVDAPSTGEALVAEPREWETDSSPYDSSSSSDSSDSDSSDDDDEEEYTLLDPYEQARILMAEDGGGGDHDNSDDEGRASSRPNAGLRTVNEKPEEILPKPNITITESMPIEELGSVQAIVENTLVIAAKTTGEYRVLESNSLLCTAARLPIGVVAETIGRVEAPLYTVRFASETDIRESGVNEKGTKIFYVPTHSTFVFTTALKSVKGSDASNFHDEEVGDEEMEFSDDEAEAEHKRQVKLRRKGIDPVNAPPSLRGGRGGRGQRGRGGRGGGGNNMHSIPESDTASAYGSASVEMNYDEVEEGETEYTPLRRPDTMMQINPHAMSTNDAMSPPQMQNTFTPRSNQDSRGGRGGRGRGNHNHNNRGRGRGGFSQNNRAPPHNQNTNPYQQNNYSPSSNTSMYATPSPQSQSQHFHALPPPPPPPAPHLTPSSGPYNNVNNGSGSGNGTPTGMFTVPPSPMTPLPGSQFNFNFTPAQYQAQLQTQGQAQAQAQAQGHSQGYGQGQSQNQAPGQYQSYGQAQPQPQTQAQLQNQWAQYHANLNQYQQQAGGYGAANTNADSIAHVQRTLEELRRVTGGGGYGGNGWNAGQQR